VNGGAPARRPARRTGRVVVADHRRLTRAGRVDQRGRRPAGHSPSARLSDQGRRSHPRTGALLSRRHADVIIPWHQQHNLVAIDLITEHIRTKLQQHVLRRIYPNLEVIPSNYQVAGGRAGGGQAAEHRRKSWRSKRRRQRGWAAGRVAGPAAGGQLARDVARALLPHSRSQPPSLACRYGACTRSSGTKIAARTTLCSTPTGAPGGEFLLGVQSGLLDLG
jgi:hypothetical protein